MARVPEHVRRTQSPDGAILLDVKRGRMYTLNLVGSKILELLDRQYTTAQMAGEISLAFGIDTDTALRDVEEFLGTLAQHRLIEAHPAEVSH